MNVVLFITDQERAMQHFPRSWMAKHLPGLTRLQERGLTFDSGFNYDLVTDVSDHRFAAKVSESSTALAPFHRVKPSSASRNEAASFVSRTFTM
jgi:hypothetical protein